jgi:16S rRNA (guanine966-N2)-methyltransferase
MTARRARSAGQGASRVLGESSRQAPGQVRIIGGRWKRTPLPLAATQGLRPTPDRVRETLFNWLGQTLDGWRCLDLFAGTAALGLEAASRGAERVVLVERDRQACEAIRKVMGRLSAEPTVQLVEGDALETMARLSRTQAERFDLVFLDPPFGQGWVTRLLPSLTPLLAPGALVYVESEQALTEISGNWLLERSGRAGQVHYHVFRWGGSATPDR